MANSPIVNSSAGIGVQDKPALPDKDALVGDANALLDEARSVGGKLAEEAQDQVGQLAEAAKAQVAEATEKFKGMASEQKDLLAQQVGGVAEALERVATDLETENGPSAQYARVIADNAVKLSSTIRDNDVDQMLEIAQDFGRKQPAAFMGAAALLGFAASRFLLASSKRLEAAAVSATPQVDPSPSVETTATGSESYQPNTTMGGV